MAVRRESVQLSLDDAGFSTGMARAAAATALLDKSLDSLDGSTVRTNRDMPVVAQGVEGLGVSSRRTGSDINMLTGRLALMAKAAAALGPGLIPISAVAVPALTGLASQLGFAAVGMGTLVAASQGVGDALKTVNDASLDPTTENLEKAAEAMKRLGPEAQNFVTRFQELRPVLGDIRDHAAAGWFPGLTQAMDDFERVAPRVATLFEAIGTTGGQLVAEAAESLAGPEWAGFIDFITTEGPPALEDLGRSIGNVALGMADLWQAFSPLNNDFSAWMLDASRSFSAWADGVSETDGFQEFIAYIRESGPVVAEAAGAIGNALLQIVQAAAPLGGPVLQGVTALANAIAAIADSPLGTPLLGMVTAMSALNLASRTLGAGLMLAEARLGRVGVAAARAQGPLASLGGKSAGFLAVAAGVTALGNALAGVTGAKLDMSDLTRDLEAMAQGRTSEALTRIADDLSIVNERVPVAGQLSEGINEVVTGFGLFGNTGLDNAQENLESFDQALAQLVESGNAEKAAEAMETLAAKQLGVLPGSSISPAYMKELSGSFDAYSTALENTSGATSHYAGTVQGALRWQRDMRVEMSAAREAARESAASFLDFSDALGGDTFSFDAWIKGFEAQVKAMAAFRDNIAKLRAGGLNDFALDELIKQGPAAAQAVAGLAKAGAPAIDRLNGAVRRGRGEIKGMGQDAAQSKRQVKDLGNTPANPTVGLNDGEFQRKRKKAKGDVADLGNDKATPNADLNYGPFSAAVSQVRGMLNSIDGASATTYVYTRHIQVGSPAGRAANPTLNADGGFHLNGVRQFADGGWGADGRYYERVPQIIPGGANILWGEQETGWEAYISGKPGMRERNLDVLSEAASRLGATVTAMADGGGRGSGGSVRGNDGGATSGLRGFARALKASERALEREKAQRDAVVDKMKSLSSDVTGNLRSELFGGNEWSSGSPIDVLRGDIAKAQLLNRSRATLSAKGLDGDALAEVLRQDPQRAAEMAAGSAAQIAQFERLYKVRDRVTGGVGAAAGRAAYGAEVAKQTRELRAATRELRQIKSAIKNEHREDRRSNRKGASRAARRRPRGQMP